MTTPGDDALILSSAAGGIACPGVSAAAPPVPARPALRTATPTAVWLLCGVLLGLALAWSVVVPTFRGPQEIAHVDRARDIAARAGLPPPGVALSRQVVAAGQHANFWSDFSDSPSLQPDRTVRYRIADAAPRTARPSFDSLFPAGGRSPVVNPQSASPPLYHAVAAGVLAVLPATTAYDVVVWLLRALGARTIVVLSYFLFTGLLEDRVRQQAAEFDAAHDDVAVVAAGHLGVNDRVADLAVERYHEAAVGAPPRSCDTCVYRVAMPGFEDRVGSPLQPHHHPDDPATHDHGPVESPVGPHHHPHDPATHDHGPGGSPLAPHHHPHEPTTDDHEPTPVPGSETSGHG
ncbi:MAG: hypothetical protein BRC32_03745 [Actinobacteria bacterium QS_8_72_14]|nr:MAG: hypothetical protein BRC32_03745 [Actinobacteria bacterium QS_8_72_14]